MQNAATSGVRAADASVASATVNTAQQIGGSSGTAVFSLLAALAASGYLVEQPAQVAEATLVGYRLVSWVAAAVVVAAITAVLLFRSGPLPTAADEVLPQTQL